MHKLTIDIHSAAFTLLADVCGNISVSFCNVFVVFLLCKQFDMRCEDSLILGAKKKKIVLNSEYQFEKFLWCTVCPRKRAS